MFEMLTGRSPFYSKNVDRILENIMFKDIPFDNISSKKARNLVVKLLERNFEKRLGATNDALDIMEDPFFDDIDWEALRNKKVKPPFEPNNTCDS
mmetsp:Transcript_32045/g.36580  ORF Transcript_32045/g.36580 Transcript_32045/m.36580 type:complete len:95 (+) Transcript_32045:459-743(+)